MKLIEIHWEPTDRQLRQFALAGLFALPALTWLITRDGSATSIAAGVAALMMAVGWLVPRALKPIFLTASVVTAPIGIVVGEVTVLLVYIGVVTPIGMMLRLFGKDPLDKRPDPEVETYWEPRPPVKDLSRYYRQS